MPVSILKSHSLDLSSPALASIAGINQLLCDRIQYASDERYVHVYANLAGPAAGGNLIVTVADTKLTLAVASNRLGFVLDISSLAPGSYAINCRLDLNAPQTASFTKLAASGNPSNKTDPPFPNAGIPLRIAEIRPANSGVTAYGTHALVPLPREMLRVHVADLRVYENDELVPSQVDVIGTWDGAGTPKWLHVFFTAKWDNGIPRHYRLRNTGAPQPANGVVVDDTPAGITIAASQARIAIPRPFQGISINSSEPASQHIVDEHGKRWMMGHDASVVIESRGAALAVVKISGAFRDVEGAAGPWQFTTRIRIAADSPVIRFQHSFQWNGNAVEAPRIADLAFNIPFGGATRSLPENRLRRGGQSPFVPDHPTMVPAPQKGTVPGDSRTGSQYSLGLDGKSAGGQLPAAASVFAHQERDNLVTGSVSGRRCDGWFSLVLPETRAMTLFVKEFWQRFPQEVELGRDGIVLHSWPLHGRDNTYSQAEQLSPQNFHRGLCFHSGRLLTLKWPRAYADQFDAKYRNETDPGWNATAQILAAKVPYLSFTTEFAVMPAADDQMNWNALFLQNPLATPPATWLETAQPMPSGPIAAQGTDFPEIEAAVKRAVVGFYNLGRLSNFTGKFNYGDTHHDWVLPEDRPSEYRTCYSNHYYSLTTIFTLYLRSGDSDLLALGRRVLDHAVSVDAIRYAGYAGFYHKGIYHWAGPTEPNGHHVDLEGILLGYMVADDRYALDNYHLWLTYFWNVLYCELAGRERDAHCDLVRLVHLFQQEWDVRMLPAMRALAANLMEIPIAKQSTATWHPTWMSDYWRFTRDPAMAAYLVANTSVFNPGHEDGVGAEHRQGLCPGTTAAHWHLACQEIAGDPSYTTRHLPFYDQLRYATVAAPNSDYDGFGALAGQSGEGLRTLVWPYLLHSLRTLGVKSPPNLVYGCYPVVDSSYGSNDPRRVVVYILKTTDEPWTVNLDNDDRNQDSGGVLQILSPRGRPISPYTTIAAAIGDGTVLTWVSGPKFDSPWVYRATSLCVDDAYSGAANYTVESVDSPTRIALTTPAPPGRHRIDFYDHGVGGEGNVPYCRPRFAGARRVHKIPADRETGVYKVIWGGGPCGMLAPLSIRADGKSHWQ
ncbi:MAG TPA: hypothetical protein VG056_01950, partial [Pirellulales bacterium]|nr:hypothetical protein [Pirellulales bacterium]